jgi:DNA polymerase-4
MMGADGRRDGVQGGAVPDSRGDGGAQGGEGSDEWGGGGAQGGEGQDGWGAGDRVILHVDMNAFYASVEALSHPEVQGRPMAVCGDPALRRGIVLAKNEAAKRMGVRTAEPVWQAQRKCPGLILLPPHHALYAEYCAKANAIYGRFTDMVEQAGIDESYLDVTGSRRLFGGGRAIADAIRETTRAELGLTVSVGVSFCKVFAKLGSDYKKPDATTVIPRSGFRQILHPLPVTDMLYVGQATARALAGLGVTTIGGLAELDEGLARARLGKHGAVLRRYARGEDDEPVARTEEAGDVKSVGNGMTFRRDLVGRADVAAGLRALAETVAYRLRRRGKLCAGVQVAIKDPAFNVIDRQARLARPTNATRPIYEAAMALVEKSWKPSAPIRLLTVTAISLLGEGEGRQASLFDDDDRALRQDALERSLDKLRDKYGRRVVKPASTLDNDLGIDD